jgi:2-methylcitrate dehydratase PrpD
MGLMKQLEAFAGEGKKYTSEILAAYSHFLEPGDIPAATVETVQRCLLDLIAAAVAGAQCEPAVLSRQTAKRMMGDGASGMWFAGDSCGAAGAAFANSAGASALDLDDGHRAAGGHPGSAVIPAVLAVAQEVSADWPSILAAIVVGYEVGVRVSAARDFSALDTFSTGRWSGFGVAAAAGRLRGLSIRQTAEAMSLAGVLSPGLSAAGYSRVMGNHAKEGIPWSTFTGLWAVELAAGGFTGPVDILDHPDYYDAAKIKSGLGDSFAVDKVYFKPYGCCRWIHCALESLERLSRDNNLRAADIASIEVHTFERALRLNNYADPGNLESAQYSIPFCLAVAAVEGRGALLPLRTSLLHRRDIIAFAERVTLHPAPELDRLFPERTAAEVIVRTGRGSFSSTCYHPLGDPDYPMDWEMLVRKFREIADGLLSEAMQNRIIEAVHSLPIRGPEELAACLGGTGTENQS